MRQEHFFHWRTTYIIYTLNIYIYKYTLDVGEECTGGSDNNERLEISPEPFLLQPAEKKGGKAEILHRVKLQQ